jgi:hypothetical protein
VLQTQSILAKRKYLIGRNQETLGHSPWSQQSEPANPQADPKQMLEDRNNLRPHSHRHRHHPSSSSNSGNVSLVEKPTNSALKAKSKSLKTLIVGPACPQA